MKRAILCRNVCVAAVACFASFALAAPTSPTQNGWPPRSTSPLPPWQWREEEHAAWIDRLNHELYAFTMREELFQAGASVPGSSSPVSGSRIRRYSCDAAGPVDEQTLTVPGAMVLVLPLRESNR
jgi:hypothetical protein